MHVPVAVVSAGDTLVRGCGTVTKNFALNASPDIDVIYRYPILGEQTVAVHFESRKDTPGVARWFETIETPRLTSQ